MNSQTTVFCLHYLGGSGREWSGVAELLRNRLTIVTVDLPGFGDAIDTTGYGVSEMAEYVTKTILSHEPEQWMIAGHSMGAKVATVIARNAEDGAAELDGLVGLILVAGSPPHPEPMSEDQREKMLGWFLGDAESKRAEAYDYVSSNSGPQLDAASRELAEGDVSRTNRAAWVAWLESGSKEDWSERAGILMLPALVVAGADDPYLGPDGQRKFMLPHFKDASLVTLANAKHLLPMECGEDLARLMDQFNRSAAYSRLIASSRVSTPTRKALESRGQPDDPKRKPQALDGHTLTTLRAVVDRVIPQNSAVPIDIAARIDEELAASRGDGWRFAALPNDVSAFRDGLKTIEDIANYKHEASFQYLDIAQQEQLLTDISEGHAVAGEVEADRLDSKQLRLWFEDVRAAAVRAYLGHPSTLARIGYSGIANGGDGMPKSGFALTHIGEREAWEPIGVSDTAR